MNTYAVFSLGEAGKVPTPILEFKAEYLKVDSQRNILAYDKDSKLIAVFPAGLIIMKHQTEN